MICAKYINQYGNQLAPAPALHVTSTSLLHPKQPWDRMPCAGSPVEWLHQSIARGGDIGSGLGGSEAVHISIPWMICGEFC